MSGRASKKKYKILDIKSRLHHPFKNFALLNEDLKFVMVHKVPARFLQRHAVCINEFIETYKLSMACKQSLHCYLYVVATLDAEDNANKRVVIVWETIPTADHPTIAAGYRIWSFIKDDNWSAGEEYAKLYRANKKRIEEQDNAYFSVKKRVEEHAKLYMFHDLASKDQLLHLFSQIQIGTNFAESEECIDRDLSERLCDGNPLYVYSPQQAMFGIPDADPEFTDIRNYLTVDENGVRRFHFPDPDRLIRLTPEQAKPKNILHTYLPHIRSNESASARDTQWFREMFTSGLDIDALEAASRVREDSDDSEDEDSKDDAYYQVPIENLPRHDNYMYVVGQQSGVDLSITTKKLTVKNAQRRKDIRKKMSSMLSAGESAAEVHKFACAQRKLFETEAMAEFKAIWNEHAPVSNELLHVIRWGEQWLQENKNFCGYLPKLTDNLPVAAEWTARMLLYAELIFWVYAAHDMLIMVLVSQFDAYGWDRKDKFHYLALGPPGASKSYLLDLGKMIFILNTVATYNYRTAKCDTGTTNMDGAILQSHEMSEVVLGVRSGKGSTSSPAHESSTFFKDRMTMGEFNSAVTHIDKETGERTRLEFHVDCNGTYQGNSNILKHMMDPAIADRFYLALFEETKREDKMLQDLLGIRYNDYMNEAKQKVIGDIRRDQYLLAMICKLIEVKILPEVDLSYSHLIVNEVLKRADSLGLPRPSQTGSKTDNSVSRTVNRIQKIVTNLVILNAIYIVFNSPASPLRDKPWEDSDILLVAPFLRATIQEPILALGFVKNNELENRRHSEILKTIRAHYFNDADSTTATTDMQVEPDIVTVESKKDDGKDSKESVSRQEEIDQKKDLLRQQLVDSHAMLQDERRDMMLSAREYQEYVNKQFSGVKRNPHYLANYTFFANRNVRRKKSKENKDSDASPAAAAVDNKRLTNATGDSTSATTTATGSGTGTGAGPAGQQTPTGAPVASSSSGSSSSNAGGARLSSFGSQGRSSGSSSSSSSTSGTSATVNGADAERLARLAAEKERKAQAAKAFVLLKRRRLNANTPRVMHVNDEAEGIHSANIDDDVEMAVADATVPTTNSIAGDEEDANVPELPHTEATPPKPILKPVTGAKSSFYPPKTAPPVLSAVHDETTDAKLPPPPTGQKETEYAKTARHLSFHEKLMRMATVLRAKMKSRPAIEDICNSLRDMTLRYIKERDTNTEIPILAFEGDGFVVATEAIVNQSDDDIIQRSIEYVLSHKFAREQRIAFAVRKNEPFIMDCLDIKPTDRTLQIANPTFADERQRSMLELSLLNLDGKPIVDLDKVYDKAAFTNIDEDPEDRFFTRHIMNIWWSKEELDKNNFGPAYVMDEYIRQLSIEAGKKPAKYPEEAYVPSNQRKQEHKTEEGKNPDKFSSRRLTKENVNTVGNVTSARNTSVSRTPSTAAQTIRKRKSNVLDPPSDQSADQSSSSRGSD